MCGVLRLRFLSEVFATLRLDGKKTNKKRNYEIYMLYLQCVY